MIAYQRGDELAFVLRDHLGSTRVSVSSDGTSGVGYSYDALGNLIDDFRFGIDDSNTPLLNRQSEIQNRQSLSYRYTGQEFDNETGLHNFRARLYDSDLFRFYSTDPAGEQHSPYAFVGNSPLMFRDPTGAIIDPFSAALIFAGFNALSSGAMAASSGGNFFAAAGRSLLGSAISMGVSAGVGGIFNAALGYAGTTLSAAGEVAGIAPLQFGLSGAISGGINAGLNGGNVLQGALLGGGLGALSAAGYYSQYQDQMKSGLLAGIPDEIFVDKQSGEEVYRIARPGTEVIRYVDQTTVTADPEFSALAEFGIGFIPFVSSGFDMRKGYFQLRAGDYWGASGSLLMAGVGLIPGGGLLGKGAKIGKAIVIGEGMGAVKATAKTLQSQGINAKWYQAWSKNFPKDRLMTPAELGAAGVRNARWLESKINQGYKIYDIGIDATRVTRSPFYTQSV